jgi:hypothetical protein
LNTNINLNKSKDAWKFPGVFFIYNIWLENL